MDLSLTTDFESALLNWDVDEVNNATSSSHQLLTGDDGKQKIVAPWPASLAAAITATSIPTSLTKQEPLEHFNHIVRQGDALAGSKRTATMAGLGQAGPTTNNPVSILDDSISPSQFYHSIPSSSDANTTVNNEAQNLYHDINTSMDNRSHTSTQQQNGYPVSQHGSTSGYSASVNVQTAGKESSSAVQVEQQQRQMQQQQRTPQHLQLDGGNNACWNLQDSSPNNLNGNIGAPSSAPNMYPQTYFLPGIVPCDLSQTHITSQSASNTKQQGINVVGGVHKSNVDNSKPTSAISHTNNITSSALLALQQHHNQLTPVNPWVQQVPQYQAQPQSIVQMSNTHPISNPESTLTHQTLAAQNLQHSQMSSNNGVLDAPMTHGNNISGHQTIHHINAGGYGSSLQTGSSTTTTNGTNESATASVSVGRDGSQKHQQISQLAPMQFITTNSFTSSLNNNGSGSNSGSGITEPKPQQNDSPPQSKPKKKARKNKTKKHPGKPKAGKSNTPPPFYLFDAPCELRTNFIQAQRLNNITVVEDNNAYHYSMAVNGFHPQLNAQANPTIQPTNKGTSPENVVLLDGRHKNKIKQGNERNEREQQRAQKITELIDKLRLTMVNGGWKKNEMKSKYQTLSTCAAYVKHLVQETKKKEAAIEEAKANLAIRDQKREEEKSLQDSRSDPESVISSLTTSSVCGGDKGQICDEPKEKEGWNMSSLKAISSSGGSDDNNNNSSDTKKNNREEINENKGKVAFVGDHQSGSIDSSSTKDPKNRSDLQDISINNRCLSMSEISDSAPSSKGCSGSDSGDGNTGSSSLTISTKNGSEQRGEDVSEASSISSTAAVVSGSGSKEQENPHCIVNKKPLSREKTSMEVDFELNYQEVFLASNIPQLIATQTGRIAICNDFFHRATGMSEQDVQRITIFSIVQADKLSTLFELVATSLRRSNSPNSTEQDKNDISTESLPLSKQLNETYTSVTLPCIPFPKGVIKSNENGDKSLCPLFMTVTCMSDEDPKNRCIHCVLTENGPGPGGKIGHITTNVLKNMFNGDS